MKSHLLFPRYFRPIGFLLAIPGLVLGYLFLFEHYTIPGFGPPPIPNGMLGRLNTYTNELALTLVVLGLMFIAFSKVKLEDELTAYIRLNALYWAILINYLMMLARIIFQWLFGDFNYTDANLIMPLIIFILRFYYLLYRNKDEYHAPPLYFLPHKPYNKAGKMLSLISLLFVISGSIILTSVGSHTITVWDEYFYISYYILPFILLIWVYSKEHNEDEYINAIRLNAMQTAIYVNFAILLLANFLFFGFDFLWVENCNFSTIPLIFILVFKYRLYQLSKNSVEKSNSKITLNTL